jgi:hypothetical protein
MTMILIKSLEYFTINWVIFSWLQFGIMKLKKMSCKFPKTFSFEQYLCLKCITFWSTLFITQNIFAAAIASFYAWIFDNKLND